MTEVGAFSPIPYQSPRTYVHDDSAVFSADFSVVVSSVVAKVVVGIVTAFSACVAVVTALLL